MRDNATGAKVFGKLVLLNQIVDHPTHFSIFWYGVRILVYIEVIRGNVCLTDLVKVRLIPRKVNVYAVATLSATTAILCLISASGELCSSHRCQWSGQQKTLQGVLVHLMGRPVRCYCSIHN